MTSELMSRQQAAEYLGIGLSTLAKLNIPQVRISKRLIRYRVKDLNDYINGEKK